jgi:nitroreductase
MSRLLTPWQIESGEFPTASTTAQKLKFLINYAILAPSGHNTQPWQFKIINEGIELFADKNRALPVVAPNDRELIISCGAALFNLRLAIRYFGGRDLVETFPDSNNSNLLARIRLGDKYEITSEENLLFKAISLRHTNRFPFTSQKIPDTLLAQLQQVPCSEDSRSFS